MRMGVWNFSTGLVLLMVFLKIQASEAVHKGNSSHGSQRKVFLDLRQNGPGLTEEVEEDFLKCSEKWFASVGDSCVEDDPTMMDCQRNQLLVFYKGDTPGKEIKEIYQRSCQRGLSCSDGKCQCRFRDSYEDTPCDDQMRPKQNLRDNCNRQSKAFLSAYRRDLVRSIQSGVSDPGQNIPYIILMAVILFVLAVC